MARALAIAREGVSTDRCEGLTVGEAIRKRTMDSLRQVLEAAGVEFTNGASQELG